MESLALFVANDKFNRKDEGDNYNLRHFKVFIDKLYKTSESIIKFNDKFIGTLEMTLNTFKYESNIFVKLVLSFESFYEDFDHEDLKGLLNHLHLDHSEGLVIPKLSHDYQKSIMIVFTKEFPIDDFDSITVYKFEEQMKKTSSSDLYRNDIDLKQKQDFLFSFFQNPSYEFENIFVFRMKNFHEERLIRDPYNDHRRYRKCQAIIPLIELIINELHGRGYIYQFVEGLYDSYRDYFRFRRISEEEFVKKFYDWKNNNYWIWSRNYFNDDFSRYLLDVLTWMEKYLDEREKIF